MATFDDTQASIIIPDWRPGYGDMIPVELEYYNVTPAERILRGV